MDGFFVLEIYPYLVVNIQSESMYRDDVKDALPIFNMMDITPHSVFSPGLVIFITHHITSYLTVDVAQQWASSVPIPTHPGRQPITTTTLALDQIPSIEGSSCYKGGFGRH